MKLFQILLLSISFSLLTSCKKNKHEIEFITGGDFSVMKNLLDYGGEYKVDGNITPPLEIFTSNGYNYGRLRLFHSPNMEGSVVNSLEYTIESAKAIKESGMKLMLDIHYSDTWADPQKQYKPKAWEDLSFDVLTDSVFEYSKMVINRMSQADVLPDIVQVGNEITPGFIWPEGKIYKDSIEDWSSFITLLKAGINGVKAAYPAMPIMLHIDQGTNKEVCKYFFDKINENEINFDWIGLSYYPWWHGTFGDLSENLQFLSENYTQNIIIVETAYYANGQYPKQGKWVKDYQPFPSSEEGQYQFLCTLKEVVLQFPKVKGIFYWKPDGLLVPNSNVWFIGRSLFNQQGNVLKGIAALNSKNQNN